MALTTTTQPETGAESRRLDLDAMDARIADIEAAERAQTLPVKLPEETPEQKTLRLTDENERLRRMISHAIEARNSAVEFVNMWADPRRLPDLVQEVYQSHPDIPKVSKELGEETARRVARLVAHMAVTYQVHPLISGMIYAWPDGGVAHVEMGYRAYMEMLKRHSLDFDGPHDLTPELRAKHDLAPDDRGAVYYVFDWARMERFARYGRECQPFIGLGIWRAQNARGKADTFPVSKSGQWVAEKNALKDAARRALSFAILQIANAETFDATYDQDVDMWTVPAPTAPWTRDPLVAGKFADLLTEHGVTDDEWNTHLGHNWRYTSIEREEMRQKVLEYVAGKPAVVDGQAVLVPEDTSAVQTSEPAPTPEPTAEPAANTAPDPVTPPAEIAPVEAPAPAETAVKLCRFCLEPAVSTPMGDDLCETHAKAEADRLATLGERKGKKASKS